VVDHPDDCDKDERIKKLEENRHSTNNNLHEINLTLMRIETTLSQKILIYDRHVDEGDKFRSSIMFWLITSICGGLIIAGGFGVWVGRLQNQVDVNTKKWEQLDALRYFKPGA